MAVSGGGFQGYLLLLVNCKTDRITIGLSDVSGHFTQISPIITDICCVIQVTNLKPQSWEVNYSFVVWNFAEFNYLFFFNY